MQATTRRRRASASEVTVVAAFSMLIAMSAHAAEPATLKGTVSVRGDDSVPMQDIVIYIEGTPAEPHAPAGHAAIDQKNMTFIPHVLPVAAGTTVDFRNSDDMYHNVFSNSVAKRFDLGMFGRGETRSTVFDQPGIIDLRCNVHPKMHAYIVVLKSPYFTVPAADGSYMINGIPPGRYQLRTWEERLKPTEKWVNVSAGEVVNVNLQLEK